MSSHMQVAVIVPAAGAGRRFGPPPRPASDRGRGGRRARRAGRGRSAGKSLAVAQGVPLLVHALRIFQRHPAVRWIVVAVRAPEQAPVRALLKRFGISKALPPVVGGASRGESVLRAFASVPASARWVLVHDAARPCVTGGLVARTLQAARRHGGAACGLPVGLTVKAVDDQGRVRLTLDRERLWAAQTPQAFRRDWLAQALQRVSANGLAHFPDDASIVEAAGFPVRMVPGDPLNLKVTVREDLVLAEAILARRQATGHRQQGR
jgi:2-C-methyl-D-erythritol 4-phosphate cytidylyltransferase